MKKILILVLALFCAQASAVYVEAGLGVGGASTSVDGKSIGDNCQGCSSLAVNLGFRVGGQLMDNLFLAGEFSAVGDRYYNFSGVESRYYSDKDYYIQFNSYIIGPSVAYYPVNQLHLSASLGFVFTGNDTNVPLMYVKNGTGFGGTATVAYHFGDHNGTLLGARFTATSVTVNSKDLFTVGLALFVSFVHM